jgi:DNA-binding PadR family transcriptional regulator
MPSFGAAGGPEVSGNVTNGGGVYTLYLKVYEMKPIPLNKELVAASSRPMVLSILAGGESYGWEILQKVSLLSQGRIEWSDGMLYPVLRRLEKDGLIVGDWRTAESGRRRKYYRLSDKGKKQLADDREGWQAVHDALSLTWEGSRV